MEDEERDKEDLINELKDCREKLVRMTWLETDRREAKDKLEQSEARFRNLFENSPLGISIARRGITIEINRKCMEMFGIDDPAEIVGTSQLNRIAPSHRPAIVERFEKRACGEEVPKSLETMGLRKNGTTFPVHIEVMELQLADGAAIVSFFRDITVHKQAEDLLMLANQQLKNILEFLPDATFVIDKDRKVIAWNKAIEEMTGIKAQDILGKGDYEYALPFYGERRPILIDMILDPRAEIEERYADIRRGETVLAGETYASARDGGKMYLFGTASVIKDAVGNVIGAIESLRDISDRKRAENALRESEERYKTLFNSTSDGIFILNAAKDDSGKIVSANAAAAAMNGYTLDELLRLHIQDLDTPESRKMVSPRIGLVLSGEKLNFEVMNIRKDGSIYPVEVTANAIEIGGHSYIFAIHRDITERKRAEELLAAHHEWLITILDGIPVPTFMIDRERTLVLWNRSNEIFTGKTKELLLGKRVDLSFLFKEKTPPTLAEILVDMSDDEIARHFGQGSIRISDAHPGVFESTGKIWLHGEERIISIQASRVYDAEGNMAGAIQNAQDITKRVELETQLRQAQKMEAIGTLAGGIAHDFNNILAAIIGYTDLTRLKLKQTDLSKYLDQVQRACERAKSLVNQILSFSRKTDREIKPIDMGAILKEAVKLLRATIPSTIEIRMKTETNRNAVLADPTQIHQVIINLCTNASHAMRERGGVLEISLDNVEIESHKKPPHPDLAPGMYTKLSVRDTGTGITADNIGRIFDPFFTTKKKGEGTGLGLSVIYGIIREYEGAVIVESEIGTGSVFHVYLPSAALESKVSEDVATPLPGGHERILFIDDEDILAEMGRELLEELGYKVIAVTDSAKALDVFRTHADRFDLIITDMTMPVMTGVELARLFFAIRPDIPVILYSGFTEQISEVEARNLGIREFLMKPLSLAKVAHIVRQVLDEKKG